MKKEKIKVALVQLDSGTDKQKNLEKVKKYTKEAAKNGASIICFPELMNVEAKEEEIQSVAEDLQGETISLLRTLARKYGVSIHSGSMYERIPGDEKCYNTSVWIDASGAIIDVYRKVHLFDVTLSDGTVCAESETIKAGEKIVTVDIEFGKAGMAICYDLRFPEQFRSMVREGANIQFICASFTESTGKYHWEVLLRARAIENGCYVIAVNQCGQKRQYEAYGNSMVVDPWGTVIVRAQKTETVIYAEICSEMVDRVRGQIPSIPDSLCEKQKR